MVEAPCRIKSPARFDDELVIETILAELRSHSMKFAYRIERGGKLVATGYTRLACIDESQKLHRITPDQRAVLVGGEESCGEAARGVAARRAPRVPPDGDRGAERRRRGHARGGRGRGRGHRQGAHRRPPPPHGGDGHGVLARRQPARLPGAPLVDGKAETAWNGKTGDLGGSIEITVPAEATATAIALTAGFDKGGLFEANHRIARLLLSRDGKTTKEVRLDVNVRAPQRIAIDDPRPGGTYRLQVLETKPGTKTAWEELVVSELAVYGRAGKARVPTHLPKVTVAPGSAPAPAPRRAGRAPRTRSVGPARACLALAAWTADLSRALAKELPPESRLPPTCAEEAKVPTVTGPPPEWKRLRAVRFAWFDGVSSSGPIATSSSRGRTGRWWSAPSTRPRRTSAASVPRSSSLRRSTCAARRCSSRARCSPRRPRPRAPRVSSSTTAPRSSRTSSAAG